MAQKAKIGIIKMTNLNTHSTEMPFIAFLPWNIRPFGETVEDSETTLLPPTPVFDLKLLVNYDVTPLDSTF